MQNHEPEGENRLIGAEEKQARNFAQQGLEFEKKILLDLLYQSQNTVRQSLGDYQSTVMASITEFGRTIENMAGGIKQISSSAEELRDSVEKQRDSVESLGDGQERIDDNSKEGLEKVSALSEQMGKLNNLSNSLQEMLTDNNDIADQLHILSINGSIEAARAGSVYGAPFKVVAQEISGLSDKASGIINNQAESVKNILSIISESNRLSNETVEGFKQTAKTITENGEFIDSIRNEMDQVASGAEELSAVVKEFSDSIGQMQEAVQDIEKSASTFQSQLQREFGVNSFAVELSTNLKEQAAGARSLEDAAAKLTPYLYRKFGECSELPSLVLARIFVALPYDKLNPVDIRDMGSELPEDAQRYLCLAGTTGQEKDWNRREKSKSHRVIPLPDTVEKLESIPMLAEMFTRMEVDYASVLNPSAFSEVNKMIEGYMLVEQAEDSPFIPAQEEFVRPYGIKSELGYGGFLPSGAVYACFLFFTAPLSRHEADKLKVISVAIQQVLLPFDAEQRYWS
ncbi:MAG: methyl-accepting chemotaxis protein [Spirochaetia bacterium]